MTNKDELLLEKAYLSISKPMASVPSDDEVVDMHGSSEKIEDMIDDGAEDIIDDGTDINDTESCEFSSSDFLGDSGEETEEDEMVITNLDSIRDSVTKIASHCAGGKHLETWQQQKLAIAMDNLAEVARRIRR